MSIWEFAYSSHNDRSGVHCRESRRIVPYSAEVSVWGRTVCKASCVSCGKQVELFEVPVEPWVKPGTLVSVNHESQCGPSAD